MDHKGAKVQRYAEKDKIYNRLIRGRQPIYEKETLETWTYNEYGQ